MYHANFVIGDYSCKICSNKVFLTEHQHNSHSGYASFMNCVKDSIELGEFQGARLRLENVIKPHFKNPAQEYHDVHCAKVEIFSSKL